MSIEIALNNVKSKILEFVKELEHIDSLNIYDKLEHGKMLRSKLVLKIAGESEEAVRLCAVIEMIHLASLLHDDVIDSADTRRGKASINALYGEHTAIMFGDVLYSKAFSELTQFDAKIAYIISNAVTQLSIGELIDVRLAESFNTNKEAYFDMIYKKTSSLIEASASAAALLSGREHKNLALYGRNLGIAFQIVDDLLDILQDEERLGKPAMSDLKEGKVTLPYIYFWEDNENQREYIESRFKLTLGNAQTLELREKLIKSGAIEKTKAYIAQIVGEALEAIKDENLPELIQIVQAMTQREY